MNTADLQSLATALNALYLHATIRTDINVVPILTVSQLQVIAPEDMAALSGEFTWSVGKITFNEGWVELAKLPGTAPLHLVAKAILGNLA